MPSGIRFALSLTAAAALMLACGSDPTGEGSSGYDEHSLGWGREIADEVRDSEYPEGELFYILCPDLNDEGEPEEGVPWTFYYAAPSDTTNVLAVIVEYYTGNTTTVWQTETTVPFVDMPDYDDAGPWVSAARDTLGSEYSQWEEYALNVQGNNYPDFPLVLYVAILQFMSPDSTDQLSVIMDADESSVLLVVNY